MGKEKSVVSKEEYKKFIDDLHLLRIELLKTDFNRDEVFEFPAQVTINNDASFKLLDKKQGLYTVLNHHQLTAICRNKENPGLKIDVTFKFTYQSKIPLNDEIFKIFSKQSLVLHSWPYFRQLAQDLAARAGLPPLILDVVRI
jgi:preprotein translocase subunit SecB